MLAWICADFGRHDFPGQCCIAIAMFNSVSSPKMSSVAPSTEVPPTLLVHV